MGFIRSFALITLFSNLASSLVCAQSLTPTPTPDPGYFTVSEVSSSFTGVEDSSLDQQDLDEAHESFMTESFKTPEHLAVDPLAIAEILFKVWDFIQANRPVANVESKNASALPNIAKEDWRAVVGWKPERGIIYSLVAKNVYGQHVVELDYQLRLLYGGSVKGKGRYIASARVVPTHTKVLWGYTLNANVNVNTVSNAGSTADPLADIKMDVSYTLSNIVKTDGPNTESYELRGDGFMANVKTGQVLFPATPR